MTIINLNNNKYKNWAICSQISVIHQDREYYKITYKNEELSCDVLSEVSIEDHLWKRIHECPPVKELYEEAVNEQKKNSLSKRDGIFLKLNDLNKTDSINYEASASSDFLEGEIIVQLGQTENQLLSSIVFEMINFKQQKIFFEIDQCAKSRSIGPDEYAKKLNMLSMTG